MLVLLQDISVGQITKVTPGNRRHPPSPLVEKAWPLLGPLSTARMGSVPDRAPDHKAACRPLAHLRV